MNPRNVNDVHSRLNETVVDDIIQVDSLESIRAALVRARAERKPVAVCGGRHAMGGQQFCSGGLLVDTRKLNHVLSLDGHRRTIEVEAGIQWPRLLKVLQSGSITFAQKQTGADDLSIGGAVSANVHGRGLTMRPFVADIESLVLVGADGEPVRCSRDERPDLFRLVVGGYGLFGVVYSVTLRLVPRRTLERVVEAADGRPAHGRVRRADRPGLPLRRLSVRDRSVLERLPATRHLLVLSTRRRSASARRTTCTLRGRLAPAAPARAHRQVACVRPLHAALSRDDRAALPFGRAPARVLRVRISRRSRSRGAR